MTDLSKAAGSAPAAATTTSGRRLGGPSGTLDGYQLERLIAQARSTDASRQLQRCFPRWAAALEHLSRRALRQLAANEPVDPNDRDAWRTTAEHAEGVLHRHAITLNPRHLTPAAIGALADGQARADRDAGLDWTQIALPASGLDEALREAHARLPIDLDDPAVWASRVDQRRALAERLGLDSDLADELSRSVLAEPERV